MAIRNYFFDGGNCTAVMETQGNIVPDNTKRKITAAIICNDSAVSRLFTAQICGSSGQSPIVYIYQRVIDAGESYLCPELVGRGMGPGGYLQVAADVDTMNFKYEAIDITNG